MNYQIKNILLNGESVEIEISDGKISAIAPKLKTDSKNDAFLISSNWIKNGKIYGYHSIEPLDNQILYLYKSTDDIKVKRDIIFKTRDNSYALKYKKEDENHYMGLVNL